MQDSAVERRARLLLVSAEENFDRTLKRILSRCGYFIETVESGPEALARVQDGAYDALIAQVHLRGEWSGLSLLGQLRSRGLQLPVVLLTEEETRRLRATLRATTRAISVTKDADLDYLKSTIASCLDN